MGHSSIRIKVRRRKVANLAAYSRQHTVNNVPKNKPYVIRKEVKYTDPETKETKTRIDEHSNFNKKYLKKITFNNGKDVHMVITAEPWEKKKYPQVKPMMKKHVEWIYNKETHRTDKVVVPSTFPTKKYEDIQKTLWKNLGKAAKMKAYEDDKMAKWERKHPKPCPDDDLFKDEMIPAWNAEREQALIRIRDFVVSVFDKLPLTGRYKESDNKFVEKPVAELKDVNGDGHKVNELTEESKLLKKAQKATNKEKAKNAKLVAANLKDHKRKKGRMILPQAA